MFDLLLGIYFFVIGAIFASFLGALAYRLEKYTSWKKILVSRSHCEHCKKKLKWYELVPVISWIMLRGKCSKCGKGVSPLYTLFEIFLGFNFMLFYLNRLDWFYFVLAILLAFLAVYDAMYMHVQRGAFLVAFSLSFPILLYRVFVLNILPYSLLEAAGVAVLIVVINRIKRSFGLADILVVILMSFYLLQWKLLIGVYAAIVVGAVFGVMYAILTRKKSLEVYIPFLPFLYIGFVFTVGFLL